MAKVVCLETAHIRPPPSRCNPASSFSLAKKRSATMPMKKGEREKERPMPADTPDFAPTLTVTIDADTTALQAQLNECTKLGNKFGNALSTSFVDLALKGKSFGDVLRSLGLRLSEIVLKAAAK